MLALLDSGALLPCRVVWWGSGPAVVFPRCISPFEGLSQETQGHILVLTVSSMLALLGSGSSVPCRVLRGESAPAVVFPRGNTTQPYEGLSQETQGQTLVLTVSSMLALLDSGALVPSRD